jgi:hypothetical protein
MDAANRGHAVAAERRRYPGEGPAARLSGVGPETGAAVHEEDLERPSAAEQKQNALRFGISHQSWHCRTKHARSPCESDSNAS